MEKTAALWLYLCHKTVTAYFHTSNDEFYFIFVYFIDVLNCVTNDVSLNRNNANLVGMVF